MRAIRFIVVVIIAGGCSVYSSDDETSAPSRGSQCRFDDPTTSMSTCTFSH
jgi:hypothetical protein